MHGGERTIRKMKKSKIKSLDLLNKRHIVAWGLRLLEEMDEALNLLPYSYIFFFLFWIGKVSIDQDFGV